ncbi:hypothetical protein BHE97_08150 [Aeromicrobium sp. PE09-221]|nr:hypothetical protein BHE97_08150 [Aeromicrobium sp. PE09-221]
MLVGLLPLVLGLALWEALGTDQSFSFPRPSSWWAAASDMWQAGELAPALRRTVLTFVLGLSASIVVGSALGWLIGASTRFHQALNPILEFIRSTPSVAIVPVATVLFGVSMRMSIVVMLTAIIWPVLLSTTTARRTITPVRLEMGHVVGLSRSDQMRKVVFPSLLPAIMTGTRVSASQGLIIALIIDIIGSGEGIGRVLVEKQQLYEAASVWALMVIIGLLGLVANGLVGAVDSYVQRGWRTES